MKIFLLVATVLLSSNASANQQFEQLYQRAYQQFENRSYLLSAIHFSNASVQNVKAQKKNEALYGYALALGKVREKLEAQNILIGLAKHRSSVANRAGVVLATDYHLPQYLSGASQKNFKLWQQAQNKELNLKQLQHNPKFQASYQKYIDLNLKSPALAGTLSALIPGSGQFYLGNFESGLTSLVLNALTLSTTIAFANKDIDSAAIASGFLFSVTYLGGIISSVKAAQNHNRYQRNPVLEEMKEALSLQQKLTPPNQL